MRQFMPVNAGFDVLVNEGRIYKLFNKIPPNLRCPATDGLNLASLPGPTSSRYRQACPGPKASVPPWNSENCVPIADRSIHYPPAMRAGIIIIFPMLRSGGDANRNTVCSEPQHARAEGRRWHQNGSLTLDVYSSLPGAVRLAGPLAKLRASRHSERASRPSTCLHDIKSYHHSVILMHNVVTMHDISALHIPKTHEYPHFIVFI
jgi:hypothetical protein